LIHIKQLLTQKKQKSYRKEINWKNTFKPFKFKALKNTKAENTTKKPETIL
jgi:hypothetical protein